MTEEKNKSLRDWLKQILWIALPISIQSLFQSSFSVIDQMMVGSLGESSIASIGLGGRFPTVFFFTAGSISVGASILMSQFRGKSDLFSFSKAFTICLKWGVILTSLFFAVSYFFSAPLMSLFTEDTAVQSLGATYLMVVSIGFFPGFLSTMVASLLRNTNKAKLPMISTILAVMLNTFLNYVLIFGHFGFEAMGVKGAAIATTVARFFELGFILIFFVVHQKRDVYRIQWNTPKNPSLSKTALRVTAPILLSELAWSLGEAVYGIIYGHIGTNEMAAMTLMGPVVILSIGLFAGVYQAASILVGNQLGKKDYDSALRMGKLSIRIGVIGTLLCAVLIFIFANAYSGLFRIDPATRQTTISLLWAYATVLWIKVSNMILGGILKSGGKTTIVLMMDLIGTWGIGIPLGALSAFVFHMNVTWVYLFIAVEELVRLMIGYRIFLKKRWIQTL